MDRGSVSGYDEGSWAFAVQAVPRTPCRRWVREYSRDSEHTSLGRGINILSLEWPYDRQPHARPPAPSFGPSAAVPGLRNDQLLKRRNSPAVRAATSRYAPDEPSQGCQTARTES